LRKEKWDFEHSRTPTPEDVLAIKIWNKPKTEEQLKIPQISHNELKKIMDLGLQTIVLVDLRQKEEKETPIPGAINIPVTPSLKIHNPHIKDEHLETLQSLMDLPAQKWKERYKFPKLNPNHSIIFYSCTGKRSDRFTQEAISLGWKNVKSLTGGCRVWNKYYEAKEV